MELQGLVPVIRPQRSIRVGWGSESVMIVHLVTVLSSNHIIFIHRIGEYRHCDWITSSVGVFPLSILNFSP